MEPEPGTGGAFFDRFARDYDDLQRRNLGVLGGDLDKFAEYKVGLAARLAAPTPGRVLEFGCGVGRNLPFLRRYFPEARLAACDHSEASLAQARARNPDGVDFFATTDSAAFSAGTETYDLCFMACVLHHLPVAERVAWLAAIRARLAEDGALVIFEHNPYNPLTRHFFSTCPYDADAAMATRGQTAAWLGEAGYRAATSGYTLFFPARGRWFRRVEGWLAWLPLGGQYYAFARR